MTDGIESNANVAKFAITIVPSMQGVKLWTAKGDSVFFRKNKICRQLNTKVSNLCNVFTDHI